MMNQPVIIWAKRTPFGKYGGKLKHLEPETLLMPLFEEMNSTFPKIIPDIDDVVIGNIVGNGGNIARKALLEAGLAESIPGVTMDRQCGYYICMSNGSSWCRSYLYSWRSRKHESCSLED